MHLVVIDYSSRSLVIRYRLFTLVELSLTHDRVVHNGAFDKVFNFAIKAGLIIVHHSNGLRFHVIRV